MDNNTEPKKKTMDEILDEMSTTSRAMMNFALCSSESYYDDVEKEDEGQTGKKDAKEVLGDISSFLDLFNLKNNVKPFLIGLFLVFTLLYMTYSIMAQARAIIYLDYGLLSYSFFNVLLVILPFGIFALSTLYSFWNFHRQKMFFFLVCLVNLDLVATRIVFRFAASLFIPMLLKLQLNSYLTADMVILLMRMLTGVVTVLSFAFIFIKLYKTFFEPDTRKSILEFRIAVDTRKNKQFLYDLNIIRHMEDGSAYTVREDDRLMHTFIDGASGSGKTSMTMIRQVAADLNKKVYNEDMQKRELYSELKKGHLYISAPFDDQDFNIKYFKAKEGYESVLTRIKNKYRSCGMTFVAPDEETTDEIYELCEAKKIHCNRVDPIKVEGKNYMKPGAIGFNPFYISSHIPDWDRNREIIKKATLFADVMQFINEMKGKGDPYFTSVNRSISTAFTILLEKTYPQMHGGVQPNPVILQSLINDFRRVKEYYDEFLKLPDAHEFEFVIDFLRYDILGEGAANMMKHANGLRVVLNEFLTNPLVRSILCAENSIDMDKMLADGEVTVVNYALQLGTTDSVALGLFFVLSFNDAVIRRPGNRKTRLPHFYLIDELPILLHPQIERCFALFRKYKVPMTVAVQSLDQLEKSETTRYLRGVILGCAHHIIFGRAGVTEMKLYEDLAGIDKTMISQDTVSETSITTATPSYSYSSRTTPDVVNVMEGIDIRNRHFQEITVFSLENGSLVKPFHGKVDFLTPKDRRKMKRYCVDWASFYDKNSLPFVDPQEDITEGQTFTTPAEDVQGIPMKKDAGIFWNLVSSASAGNENGRGEQQVDTGNPAAKPEGEQTEKNTVPDTGSYRVRPDEEDEDEDNGEVIG